MIKGLRRLKGSGDKRSPTKSQEPKVSIHTVAPKQIIRALFDYEPQGDDEMKFQQRDFLYVIDDSDPEWYVACNPLLNTSGLVPVSYFELIHRPESIPTVPISSAMFQQQQQQQDEEEDEDLGIGQLGKSRGSQEKLKSKSGPRISNPVFEKPKGHGRNGSIVSRHTTRSRSSSNPTGELRTNSRRSGPTLAIYGVMLYDFSAERNDELEAHAGESIVIIAQSNTEWFVAKPIGRLGGPGLVPVSYVGVREVGTDRPLYDVEDAVKRAGVPRVEEWKRRAAEYKATSIPLGRFDAAGGNKTSAPNGGGGGAITPLLETSEFVRDSPRQSLPAIDNRRNDADGSITSRNSGRNQQTRSAVVKTFVGSNVIQAGVDSFAISGGRYWFRLVAKTADGRFRNLCRFYFDFYEFQLKLLDAFPLEAGRAGEPRTLPYMPGPLTIVNHEISASRRAFLDEYVKNLLRMPPHISQSDIMQQFFLPREGDVECDRPTNQMPIAPSVSKHHLSEHLSDSQSHSAGRPHSNLDGGVDKYGERTILPEHHQEGLQPELFTPDQEYEGPTSSHYSHQSDANTVSWHNPLSSASTHTFSQSHADLREPVSAGAVSDQFNQLSLNKQHARPLSEEDKPLSFAQVNGEYMQLESNQAYEREQTVTASSVHNLSAGETPAYIKVKVFYGDELIAIRIPSSLSFEDLYARICLRLSLQEPKLYGTPEFSGQAIVNNGDFHKLVSSSGKVTLYARP